MTGLLNKEMSFPAKFGKKVWLELVVKKLTWVLYLYLFCID